MKMEVAAAAAAIPAAGAHLFKSIYWHFLHCQLLIVIVSLIIMYFINSR